MILQEYSEAGEFIAIHESSSLILKAELAHKGVKLPVIVGQPKSKPRDDRKSRSRAWERLFQIFLPAGFPHSVTADYLPYKAFDTLQTFASTVAGLLANRAVLQGVGVGDATATATGALLLSMIQDSAGRIATILFAHRLGSSIEPECKRYRLAADVFNDAAMLADCCSPILPKPLRIVVLCTASIMRALCGTAAGSSKATLTAHFAQASNLGELNAKDASQGNAISLLGMLIGSLVVSSITSTAATWIAMLLLLTAHLGLNYLAVRSVSMKTLNRQRANLLFSHLLAYDIVLSPREVAERERIFEKDGVLRWANDELIGSARIGVSVQEIAYAFAASQRLLTEKSGTHEAIDITMLLNMFDHEEFVLWYDFGKAQVLIVLKQRVSLLSQFKAWCASLLIAEEANKLAQDTLSTAVVMGIIAIALRRATKVLTDQQQNIVDSGWRLDIAALETQSGIRLVCMREPS